MPMKSGATKRQIIPQSVWDEVRNLYETENYTQRDLVSYMVARGWKVTQPRIAQKAIEDKWVKGSLIASLKQEVESELAGRFGKEVQRFLSTSAGQARLIQREAIAILAKANDARRIDPSYTMNPITLKTVSSTLMEAQSMEARAIGFDMTKGRPMAWSPEESEKIEREPEGSIVVKEFTPEQIAELKKRSRANHAEVSGTDGPDSVENEP